MMIYEVRVSLDTSVADAWLAWIGPHMQHVVDTGCFTEATLEREMDPPEGRPAFRVRYHFGHLADLRRYEAEHAPALREEGLQKFGAAMQASRSVWEVATASKADHGA